MTKLEQIEAALRAVDAATFQRLGDDYLVRRGHRDLHPIGLAFGSAKTATGTPDTFVARSDGRFVFVEYSTQQDGLAKKFANDLAKCFDEAKTGIPVARIAEVVLCYTGRLTAEEVCALGDACRARSVDFTAVGLGTLAHDLYDRYPGLARDFLGVEVDTGQVLRPNEFVAAYGQSAVATPLDTTFRFREPQADEVAGALDRADVVLVAGRPGVGKTRLALESARRYVEAHPDAEVWCVLHRGADLFHDLRTRFQAPGHYLLVLDDANRLTRFEYALELLRDARPDRTVKLLATVRDYAAGPVQDAARAFGAGAPIVVEPLSDNEIRTLVEVEFEIRNHAYQERISDIARGNPRLAVMAARVARREESLASLHNVTALYDEYFRTVRQDVADVQDPTLMRAAAAVALLRVVDRTNEKQLSLVTALTGLTPDVFWRGVQRLHALEVFDLYEDEVVRVADQVLASYLLYLAAFTTRVVDFGDVLGHMVPRHRARLVDATNPIVSAFDREIVFAVLRPAVTAARRVFDRIGDVDARQHLLDLFWFVTPAEALAAAHDAVITLSPEPAELAAVPYRESGNAVPSASALSLLAHFGQGEEHEVETAVELLGEYVERRPAEAPLVLRVLNDAFGVGPRSYLHGFERERWSAGALRRRAEASAESPSAHVPGLYLSYAAAQLRTRFNQLKSAGGGEFRIFDFHMAATDEGLALRRALWEGVLALYAVPAWHAAAFAVVTAYLRSGLGVTDRDVVAADAAVLVPWAHASLDPTDVQACVFVHDLFATLRRLKVPHDPDVVARFTTPASELADLLTTNRFDRGNLDWEAFDAQRTARIATYAASLTGSTRNEEDACLSTRPVAGSSVEEAVVERLHAFAGDAAVLRRSKGSDADAFAIGESVRTVLRTVADAAPGAYARFLVEHLHAGNALELTPFQLVGALVAVLGADATLAAIDGAEFPQRGLWRCGVFAEAPVEAVSHTLRDVLRAMYQSTPLESLAGDLTYVARYQQVDPELLTDVVRAVVDRRSEGAAAGHVLASVVRFGSGEAVFSQLIRKSRALAEAVYLAVAEVDVHADYNGTLFEALLDADPTFAGRWATAYVASVDAATRWRDQRDYTFLWRRADHAAVITRMVDVTRADANPLRFLREPLGELFRLRADAPDADALRAQQDAVLDAWIAARAKERGEMELVFGIICEQAPERRRDRLATFLAHNTNPEDFAALQLEPRSRSWSGSAVPMYQRDLDYYESLLPLCRGVTFLRQRQQLERRVTALREQIEREKRRDFVGDRED